MLRLIICPKSLADVFWLFRFAVSPSSFLEGKKTKRDAPTRQIYNLPSRSFAWSSKQESKSKNDVPTKGHWKEKYNFYPAEHVAVVVYIHTWDSGRLDSAKIGSRVSPLESVLLLIVSRRLCAPLTEKACAFSRLTLVRWEKCCFLRCFQILPVLLLINTPLQTVNWPSVTVRGCA